MSPRRTATPHHLARLCASSVAFFPVIFALSPICIAALATTTEESSPQTLRAEIEAHTGRNFENLLKQWENRKNLRQLETQLIQLSQQSSLPDQSRYIAIQGAARLAGKVSDSSALGSLESLGKDSSWMVRTGVLKALEQHDAPRASKLAQELLRDSALVVRLEALSTLERLRPTDTGSQRSLLRAAEDPRNWQGDHPLWIPERAVSLLHKLRNQSAQNGVSLRTKIELLKKEML